MPHFDVIEAILHTSTSPSRQITPDSDDPYMRVLRAFNAPDPDTVEPVSTSSLPIQPTSTPIADTTTTQTIPTRRTARIRVPGRRIRYSDLPSSPPKRTRAVYMGTSTTPLSLSPASSPTHSPLRQRLRRATESYSEESDPDEDPEEESDPKEESDPEEDPEEEPLPTEHALVETTPVEHAQGGACLQREGKQSIEEVQGTFETGQSSRAAQIQGGDTDVPMGLGLRAAMILAREEQQDTDEEIWKDIECVQSIPPRAVSPDYGPSSPSFIPPSPAEPHSPLPDIPDSPLPNTPDSPLPDIPDDVSTPNPPDHDGITTTEQVFIQLANHASLLDVHTDQLERLGRLDVRTDRHDRELTVVRRQMMDIGRDQDRAWDAEWTAWHRMHEMESVIAGVTRVEQEDRWEVLASRRRIAQLESTVGRLEFAVERLTGEMERLRLERTRD